VDGRTLTQLRVAFVALCVALLLPLLLLVRAASARLEEQRRLKHEVVAERIFDEMERELAALLERERARPSGAYAATNTRPQSWAPFVVGYFVHDATAAQITAEGQLGAQRAQSVALAAASAWQAWGAAHPPLPVKVNAPAASESAAAAPEPSMDVEMSVKKAAPSPAKPQAPSGSSAANDTLLNPYRANGSDMVLNPYSKQEAVLRQLNRSAQSKRRAAASMDESKGKDMNRGSSDDPLSGLDDL
jgi:hypothetical protein